jgi:mRNA interferase RelE/StbE
LVWTIEWEAKSLRELSKFDKFIQKKILTFLNKKISKLDNPRVFGKPLSYDKYGLWRYRLEDYRIVCRIDDNAIRILVVKVGHRKQVYDG